MFEVPCGLKPNIHKDKDVVLVEKVKRPFNGGPLHIRLTIYIYHHLSSFTDGLFNVVLIIYLWVVHIKLINQAADMGLLEHRVPQFHPSRGSPPRHPFVGQAQIMEVQSSEDITLLCCLRGSAQQVKWALRNTIQIGWKLARSQLPNPSWMQLLGCMQTWWVLPCIYEGVSHVSPEWQFGWWMMTHHPVSWIMWVKQE